MDPVQLLFYVAALVLLILAGLGVPSSGRAALGWLGLACWLIAWQFVPLLS